MRYSKPKAPTIKLIGLLLPAFIGLGLIIYGITSYYLPMLSQSYINNPTENTENPPGFLFFSSEDIIQSANSSMHFMIEDIDCNLGCATVDFEAKFFLAMNSGNNSTVYFVLQALGTIDKNANVSVNGLTPTDFVNASIVIPYNRTLTSYLLTGLQRSKVQGSVDVNMKFIWRNVFWRRSFYEFSLVVPFQFNQQSFITDVGLPQETINANGILTPDNTDRTMLSIARPEGVFVSSALPNPDTMTFASGKVWYFWDIAKRSDPRLYSGTAISLDMEVNALHKSYTDSSANFYLLLGISIPFIISSIGLIIENAFEGKTKRGKIPQLTESNNKTNSLEGLLLGYLTAIRHGFSRDETASIENDLISALRPSSLAQADEPENNRLHRFDLVFRTVLVVASITLSATFAFYRDILPSYSFLYSIAFFSSAIIIWSYSTMRAGSGECVLKVVAWWTLMSAFTLLISRLIFSSFLLPPLVTTISLFVSYLLTRPLVLYFRNLMLPRYTKALNRGLILAVFVTFLAEIFFLIVTLILNII